MKQWKIERRKVSDLKFYPGNPRKISKEMLEKLKNSIREFGAVEPLVVNTKNEVIGGNQRLKALQELGIEEVDCIVVDLPKSKEKALNIALNKIQGEFDEDLLKSFLADIELPDLDLTGLDEELEWLKEEKEKTIYTTKISTIHYEPRGIKPNLSELYDDTKYKELLNEINNANIPDDIKYFLQLASTRFIKFYFSKIADFYAHSDKEIQQLFEKLALVIVDFNNAIANGLVEFNKRLQEIVEFIEAEDEV
jgi:hypothetical protein